MPRNVPGGELQYNAERESESSLVSIRAARWELGMVRKFGELRTVNFIRSNGHHKHYFPYHSGSEARAKKEITQFRKVTKVRMSISQALRRATLPRRRQ
jgi:hypothetical protein